MLWIVDAKRAYGPHLVRSKTKPTNAQLAGSSESDSEATGTPSRQPAYYYPGRRRGISLHLSL